MNDSNSCERTTSNLDNNISNTCIILSNMKGKPDHWVDLNSNSNLCFNIVRHSGGSTKHYVLNFAEVSSVVFCNAQNLLSSLC